MKHRLNSILALVKYSLILASFFLINSSCDEILNTNKPDDIKWEYGSETTYTIRSGSESFTDSLTGYKFVFPSGSSGTLTVVLIKKGPPIKIDAKMFGLTYTGKDTFKIIMPHKKDALDFLYEYKAQSKGAIDRIKNVKSWWGVEIMETTDDEVIFTIVPNQTKTTKGNDDVPQTQPLNSYAFGRIPEATNNQEIIKLIKQGLNEMVQHFADTYLSGTTKQKFLNNHKLINIEIRDVSEDEGSAVAISQGIFSTTAIFWFSMAQSMSQPVFAHEAGHYINYLLLGNDLYDQENQRFGYQYHIAFKTHTKGRGQGLKEDTPYFLESLLSNKTQIEILDGTDLGLWKRWIRDPQDPNEMKTPIYQPSERDFPGVEGFAAMMLKALTATNEKCYNFLAIEQNTADARRFETRIPALGVPPEDVISNVILKYPKNINEMMTYVFNYLEDYRKSDIPKYIARMEPLGWSYNGKAIIVDEYGKPVPKAQILPIIQTGQSTRDYWTDFSLQSDDKGNCIIPRLYPAQSILRVFYNNSKDSADFPCSINFSTPTNETIDLGTLVVTNKASIEITPANMEGTEKTSYTWTANVSNGPEKIKYVWNFGDGSPEEIEENNNTILHTYNVANTYTITVEAFNLDDGKSIGEATTTAKIGKPSLNFTTAKVFIDCNATSYHHIWWFENEKRWDTTGLSGEQLCDFAGYSDANRMYFPGVQGRKYKGTFSGTTFNGTCTGGTIRLTISGDLKTLVSFSCTFSGESDLKNFVIQNSSAEGGNIPQTLFQADYKAEYTVSGGNSLSSIVYVTNCKNATDNSFNQLLQKSSSVKSILIRFEN